uniref:Uncharacterized protein n=1 Tax=Pithovirus LCPAC406 TaxID=2506599 RepID=A0A481ZFR8_9VIRU|nr:MAG: hypothetical protein LCPAC406_02660 [Pithovirus LCPAC406]
MNKLKVIGYSNRPNSCERNWVTSLARCGYDYQLIGQNEKWEGWVTRPRAYLRYLQSRSNDKTIYVFIDVHDMAANSIIDASEEYIAKFQSINKSIVIGAEPNCTATCCRSLTNYWNDNKKILPNVYLNWGLVSGYRNELIDLMKYLICDYEQFSPSMFHNNIMLRISYKGKEVAWNEQIVTRRYMDLHPDLIHLDCTSNFIGNIICHPFRGNVRQYTCHGDKIFNKRYITYPFFIHTPASNIDAFLRYNHYIGSILGNKYERAEDSMKVPGYHWLIIGIIVLIIVLLSLSTAIITWIVAIFLLVVVIILIVLYYNALHN